ncbi:MAG: bifunctional demethylmenaquinone methyltransferase/2-methoxy-6-polyprenyl-1,4-benzoquinol methylase UbiE [Desulfobacterales bacterium]|nr:bifunctional demethylmenaquinone methyltransferase/2-methoxy-6-polyprenyl-1,4-benzoquinol methylase UbiE [Desulfobacterales bacterium]
MNRTKYPWLNGPKKNIHDQAGTNSDRAVYFGFDRVSEKEKARKVYQHFETIARQYDLMNTVLSFGIHHLWKRAAVDLMGLNPGDRVLDLCGGTGDLAVLADRRVRPSGRVVLYDINSAMIQAGKCKPSYRRARKRVDYIRGDALRISFCDQTFDAAMVGFGIRNVPSIRQGFSEMYRILRPGGKMMCLEFSRPTSAVFRWLYDVYSYYGMPFLGEVIVGSRKAYTHLPASIRTFPLPHELTAMLKNIGFSRVTQRNLTNGIAVIHLAEK